jgi:tRNA A37 threonylcarbamoyladenosine dehydratase
MGNKFDRTKRLLGADAMNKLKNSHVAVFGIGGVGGHAADALVRSGIGEITIVDSDDVAESNINRQLIATTKTIGRKKVAVMEEHLLEINPEVKIHAYDCFFLPETQNQFDFLQYDYVIDAVDTVTAKLALVEACKEAGVPIVSSMGAGNKLDPTAFEVTDIYKTSVCPLAKVMRKELKARGIKKLKVVYSKEVPLEPIEEEGFVSDEKRSRRATPGSVAFVPSVAGLILAGEVIKDLA